MSDPFQKCVSCDRVRSCLSHPRAEFPPDAAEAWLLRTCPRGGDDCSVVYWAGVTLRGPVTGQEDADLPYPPAPYGEHDR